jgi:hypothetical protein
VAAAAAGDDANGGRGIRGAAVDDFVGGVEGDGGVCEGAGAEGGGDEVGWVVDEVFSYLV